MKILLKGSRFESKRDSLEAGSIEELYGPPVAVPFKWEESPGKAKPVEKEPVLQIEGSHEFCNRLLTKEGSLGCSSGSLYKTITHGNVPFHWEDEPGKPKTPARDEECATLAPPLSPPPFLQSAGCTTPMCTVQRPTKAAPKRFAKKMMMSIFQGMFVGVSKPSSENNNNNNNNNENSKQRSPHECSVNSFDSARLGSDELGVSDSISRNASSSVKSSSVDDTSDFSNDEACRISDPAPRCFARCPVPLPRNLSRSRNSVNDQNYRGPLDLKNAYISMVMCMRQSSKKNSIVVGDNEESLEQQEGGSEFQDAATDFVAADETCDDNDNNNSNNSNSSHENSCCRPGEVNDQTTAIRRANARVMEAELFRRLAHEDGRLKMVNRNFQSEIPGIFLACLPFCAVSPARRPKIQKNYEDPDQRQTRRELFTENLKI